MNKRKWILFNSQLPASPSSPRVKVWRWMRAAGAVSLQNGVWILLYSEESASQVQALLVYVKEQGGSGQLFIANSLTDKVEADILNQFRGERKAEYMEFLQHCEDFLAELKWETENEKFSYGEMEESEANFDRLQKWLPKIQARDFMGHELAETAVSQLQACQQALEIFSKAVYLEDENQPK